MTPGRLIGLVGQNIKRSRKNFIMSGVGIVVGVATFVFFIGLSEGIKKVVLGRIFLIEQMEVVPKNLDLGLTKMSASGPITDEVVAHFAGLEPVEAVFPKMQLTFPTWGWGGKSLLGKDIRAEIIADGIAPELVRPELSDPEDFRDWETEIACTDNSACPDGRTCENGTCAKQSCKPEGDLVAACPGISYCTPDTKKCEMPIPVVASNHLLELYNSNVATALSGAKRKLPKLSPKVVTGLTMWVKFGQSYLGRAAKGKPRQRRLQLVGFSDLAVSLGVTMPLSYVQRLNKHFNSGVAATEFHSLIVKVKDQTGVPIITGEVQRKGYALAEKTENAEKAADIIKTVESVFALVSVVIIGIAAINISQMFFMVIYQRKREIGLLRALGASRRDVRAIILTEAAAIGIFNGIVGALTGFGFAALADFVAARLPDFPYKPETFFEFPWWVWIAAVTGAAVFCLVGAWFPANTAARQEPAAALTD